VTQLTQSLTSIPCACHGGQGDGAGPDSPTIALVGAPNTGKSTLFNSLTGQRVTMGNWPGTTVEVSRGIWCLNRTGCDQVGCECCVTSGSAGESDPEVWTTTLVDLPGAYSLDPQSPDEELTRALLLDVADEEKPDVVVVLADAYRLAHSLYLVSQIREHPLRVVVALTMVDIAQAREIELDTRALSKAMGVQVVAIDPRRRQGLEKLAQAVQKELHKAVPAPRRIRSLSESIALIGADGTGEIDSFALEEDRFAWIQEVVSAGSRSVNGYKPSFSDRVDRVVTAPVIGPLIFLAVMWVVFQLTTAVAAPLQDFLDWFFTGPLTDWALAGFAAIGLGGSVLEGFVVNGLIAGVGTLLTFVPLMAIMFVLLALLEDSGYLARAALVADRLMRMLGLPGKAFLPFIVGFGCNVPGIAATRILSHASQRVLTSLLVPFTACTARLTVFVMIGTIFFGPFAGTAVFAMYVISIVIVVLGGLLLRKTLWRDLVDEPLIIDLPPYQRPTLRLTASVTWLRLKGFLQTASGIIVVTVAIVWALQSIPTQPGVAFGETSVGDSAYGVAAKAITPVFEPTGFATWETTSTMVVGFVAKEAVISSWAQTYALDEPEADDQPGELGARVYSDFNESSGGHPIPAALAFMVFLLAYTPCVATLAAQVREIGWKWTLFGVAMQLVFAYVLSVGVFQIGRLLI
jgi:ferrous iron transport protein B